MKVKYLTSMVGDRFTRERGEVGEVDNAEGKRLIAAGFAEAVKVEKEKKDAEAVKVEGDDKK